MAESIWHQFLTKFDVFRSHCIKMNTRRFLGSPITSSRPSCTNISIRGFLSSVITIPTSKTINWRWRIQYGDHFLLNSTLSFKLHKHEYKRFLNSLLTIPRSKMKNLKWRILYGGNFWVNSRFFSSNCTKMHMGGFLRSSFIIL